MSKGIKVYRCRTCFVNGVPLEFDHVGCGCNAKCPNCGGKTSKNLIRVR